MTRPSPTPIVRDNIKELGEALLGLPWVPDRITSYAECYPDCDDPQCPYTHTDTHAQDVDCHAPGYTPGLSKERMK